MNVTNSPTPSPSAAACSSPVRTSAESRQRARDRVDQPLLRHAVLRCDGDGVEAGLAEHGPRGLDVEQRDRRAAEAVDVAEARDAGQLVALDRPLARDLDRVAELEALLLGGVQVDDDLARPRGPVARDELERVEALVGGLDAEPEGRVVALDRLALAVEDLRLVRVARTGRGSCRRRPRPRAAPARWRARPRRSAPCRSATTRRASCPRRPRRSARTSWRRSSRTPCRSCR